MATISGIEGAAFSIAVLFGIMIDYGIFRWNRQNDVIFWLHCAKSAAWVSLLFLAGYFMKNYGVSVFIATAVAGSLSVAVFAWAILLIRRYIRRNARIGMAAALARIEAEYGRYE